MPEVFQNSICLPLNWRLTARGLEYILEDSSSTLLIYDTSLREVVSSLVDTGVVSDTLEVDAGNQTSPYEAAIADARELLPVSYTHDNISKIMCTSLLAPRPKGCGGYPEFLYLDRDK